MGKYVRIKQNIVLEDERGDLFNFSLVGRTTLYGRKIEQNVHLEID
jgi:hypothetical protein